MRMRVIATVLTASFILPMASIASAQSPMAGSAVASYAVSAYQAPTPIKSQYLVELNKTEIVYLPEPASAVVVGNPDIADISVHSSDTIFIVGRGFGETNILVLNRSGHTIMNSSIQVSNSASKNNVRIYSGSGVIRTTFNCSPYCQPAPTLGDDNDFIANNKTKAKEITNTFATGSSVTRTPIAGSATEISSANSSGAPSGRGRAN